MRFRITLPHDGQGNTGSLSMLMVTGGDHLFTQSNLIMMLIMGAALVIYIQRKKLARKAANV